MPILLDIKCAHRNIPNPEVLPTNLKMSKDAIAQTKLALDKMEEIFGVRPKGIWPPEHCVSSKTLEMLSDLGVKWTLSDEGILANSINVDFVRDFKGHLADPYHLLKTYEFKTQTSKINIIFRDSIIPNLIGFEYPNSDAQKAAADLYDRIKVIQNRILASPDDSHLLTIALDGENSWENYAQDGSDFLRAIYQLIEEDEFEQLDENIKQLLEQTYKDISFNMEKMEFREVTNIIINVLDKANKYYDEAMPWILYYFYVRKSTREGSVR